ncbi:MAG: hypothetical protein ACK55E_07175 [Cyanobacteriota bacterium]
MGFAHNLGAANHEAKRRGGRRLGDQILKIRGPTTIQTLCCLDGRYESIEEAIGETIGWLHGLDPDAGQASIGLEVSTSNGDWRTIRHPMQLLRPLPAMVD